MFFSSPRSSYSNFWRNSTACQGPTQIYIYRVAARVGARGGQITFAMVTRVPFDRNDSVTSQSVARQMPSVLFVEPIALRTERAAGQVPPEWLTHSPPIVNLYF